MMKVLLKENTVGYGKERRTYKYAWFPCRCSLDLAFGRPNLFHCAAHWKAKDDPPHEEMVEACRLLGLIPEGMPDEELPDFIANLNMPCQFRRFRGRGRRFHEDQEER